MVDLPDAATADLGPFAAWQWALIAAGGLGLGWLISRRFGGGTGNLPDLPLIGPDGQPIAPTRGPSVSSTGTVTLPQRAAPTETQTPTIADNNAWRLAAVRSLIASGTAGSVASGVIAAWLGGTRALTPTETALIDRVLADIGPPPQPPQPYIPLPQAPGPDTADPSPVDSPAPVPRGQPIDQAPTVTLPRNVRVSRPITTPAPPPSAPKVTRPTPTAPAKPPAPPPAPTRTYTVRGGDTLSGIAASQLGSAARWRDIWAANRSTIANPNLIFPGQTLNIPAQ